MLVDAGEAARRLSGYLGAAVVRETMGSGIDILIEPHWSPHVLCAFRCAMQGLTSTAHVPVHDGALVMGVADAQGALAHN